MWTRLLSFWPVYENDTKQNNRDHINMRLSRGTVRKTVKKETAFLTDFLKVNLFWEGQFFEISTLLMSYVVPVKSKVEISQNFVAFSEYMKVKYFSKHQVHV